MRASFVAVSSLAVVEVFLAGLVLPAVAGADEEILEEVRNEIWMDGPDLVQPGNSRTTPAIAIDSSGRVIVVWEADNAAGGAGADIFVRRFDSHDDPLEDPQMVNTIVADLQDYPSVAVRDDGFFYVVWQSVEFDGDDGGDRRWVRGQLFDANGSPQGSEQLVSELSSGVFAYQLGASVAALDNGTFVVVWESRKGFGTDSQDCSGGAVGCGTYSIQARRIGTNGVPVGDQFQINQDPDRDQQDPAIAPTADGGFFVVWGSDNSIGTDNSGSAIQGRRFVANGTPAGNEFQINTSTDGVQWNADVARTSLGELLVVFESPNEYLVNNFDNVRARWLDAQGVAQGNDFLVASIQPFERQGNPRVAGGVDYFMAVWEAGVQGIGSDASGSAVNGRVVVGPGEFDGGQFQVNVYEPDSQFFPSLGANHLDVMVAWGSLPKNAFEDDTGIIGRGYRFCSFFCDDFESGDTTCWSSLVSP